MSTKDDTTSLENSTNEQSLVVHHNAPLGTKDGEWTTVPAYANGSGVSQTDPAVFLHAIRRHWMLGAVVGAICAVVLGLTTWFVTPTNYTASSLIQVAMQQEAMVSQSKIGYSLPQEFEVYKNSQREWLRSPFVLAAALRKPEISSLEIVKREKDPIVWLQDALVVGFPGEAEIMQVSLTDRDKDEVTKLVRAVVEAYLSEIVETDENKRRLRLAQLDRAYTDKENETRAKRTALKGMAEQLKTTDKETLNVQQQIAMQRYGEFRRQLSQAQSDLGKLTGDLRAAEAALKRVDENPVSDFELEDMIRTDPICKGHLEALTQLRQLSAQQERAAVPGTGSKHVNRFNEQLASIQGEFDARANELRETAKGMKRAEIQEKVLDLQVRVGLQTAEEARLKEDVRKEDEEIKEIGRSSVDIEMMRSELDGLEEMLGKIGAERESLKVELRSAARIQLRQPASVPDSYDSPHVKIALTILMAAMGLILPICGIMWWDVRKQRINTPEDVAKGLGVRVMGSIPVIPGRAIRRLNSPNAKNQQWNVRLTESIDGIAAKLLRNAAIDQARVVLITSAVSGEGKTTLATQIAMSLARSGRRTVLVDFDLRRPAIDKAFQLPLHPGVSEALCGENDILGLAQPTGTKNLSVVTAGRCDRHALQALSNGVDQRLFEQLRGEYEFVMVDGSPILPVADSRYVSQHVDSVVLSVFRDYSRAPKVTAACEMLEAFGVRDIEAVVTSASEDGYGVVEK
jgi:polysaccharide biosynthesis transport protein